MAETYVATPPPVPFDFDASMADYWRQRLVQHVSDSYAGVPISKFPEDLRVYEHLLWSSCANVVVELGTQYGGSALWFRDRLRAFAGYGRIGKPLVVSVDIDLSLADEWIGHLNRPSESLVLVEGDVRDPRLPGRVAEQLPENAVCMVVEDTAHLYETTFAALRGFARFVRPTGFFVVEDTCLDLGERRFEDEWPRGALGALHDWFTTGEGAEFMIRRDLELYGFSCHPYGFLQRLANCPSQQSGA